MIICSHVVQHCTRVKPTGWSTLRVVYRRPLLLLPAAVIESHGYDRLAHRKLGVMRVRAFSSSCANAFASTLKDTTTTAFEHPRSRQGGRLRRIAVQTRLYAGPLGIRQVQGVQVRIWLILVILFLTWVLLGGPKPSIPQSKSTVPKSALSATNVERAALPLEVEKRVTADHPVHQGLLRVNGSLPVTSHPIYQLIRDAREAWNAKVERQSRTLKEADQEYRRRNGRAPPRGFDQWWKFVV